MNSDYVPKYPTSGWMRSELERLGVANRGIAYTDIQLCNMLKEFGYDVSAKKPKDANRMDEPKNER